MRTTKVFKAILEAWVQGKRRIKLEGGTWSSKTYSALQALQVIAEKAEIPLDISIVSESLPHLKQGCIRDFFNILGEDKDKSSFYHKTDHIYKRPTWNGKFVFFGADDLSRVTGPRRHILFINEANNIPWETARGLDIRTELFTILDWNPVGEFWAHEQWTEEDVNAYDHSTYLDAVDVIPETKVSEIESYRDKDPNWWNIYGLGLIGKIEGMVHPYFKQVDKLPAGNPFYGLDYGFGSYDPMGLKGGDPTVLVKNIIIGDNLYSQQMFYKWEPMTNDDIARKMDLLKISHEDPIYPDPSEPKSAEEIKRKGFSVQETEKGAGSVAFGIKKVNSYYQHWTKDSLDCIKDQRNYRYLKRKDKTGGEYLSDETTHRYSHGMDARRYAVASHKLSGISRTSPVWQF